QTDVAVRAQPVELAFELAGLLRIARLVSRFGQSDVSVLVDPSFQLKSPHRRVECAGPFVKITTAQIGVLALKLHAKRMLVVYRTDEDLFERGRRRNDCLVRLLRIGMGRRLTLRRGSGVGIALRRLFSTSLKRGDEKRQDQ